MLCYNNIRVDISLVND